MQLLMKVIRTLSWDEIDELRQKPHNVRFDVFQSLEESAIKRQLSVSIIITACGCASAA